MIIHKLSLGHVRSHTKFGPGRFSRFDVYWIQTNKQSPRQDKFIYRFSLMFTLRVNVMFFKVLGLMLTLHVNVLFSKILGSMSTLHVIT